MLIVYVSRTGNVKRFVHKLGMRSREVDDQLVVKEPYVLVTYTTGFGQAPEEAMSFLQRNHRYLVGVSASGNRNWGNHFAGSADRIANQFEVPVIAKFELSGTAGDVEQFIQGVEQIAAY